MSTPSQQTRLAELLDQLHLSQAELARRSRTSVTTTARVVHGEQAIAAVRARIVAAIHAQRAELQQYLVHRPAWWERPQLSGQRGLRRQQYHSTRWGYFP